MKTRIISIIFSIIFLLLFQYCAEDFLELKPLGEESTSTFYLNEGNAQQALTTCYAVMLARGAFSRNFFAFGDVASDDTEAAGEPGGSDQPPCQRIDQMIHLSSNTYFNEFWSDMYEGIYRCNKVIYEIPKAEFNEATKTQLVGEALFLRSMYFFYLNIVFGGVPLTGVDEPFAAPFEMPRNTVAEVFHQIQEDFKEAAGVLPKTYDDANLGRATWGAAKAYLLKSLVFESSYHDLLSSSLAAEGNYAEKFAGCEDKWQEAWNVAQEIISSHVYELESNYANLWRVSPNPQSQDDMDNFSSGDYSLENVFKANGFCYQASSDGVELINQQIVGTEINVYTSCRSYFDTAGVATGRNGWGLNGPTYELYDAYEEGDPRREISITTATDSLMLLISGVYQNVLADPSASPTRMNCAKYDPEPWEWLNQRFYDGPIDIKMFRYADVLLLAAEAGLETDHAGLARGYVNEVRTRARNSGTTGLPLDLPSLNKEVLIQERRVELAMEQHRFFDLVRWGLAYEMINGKVRATDSIVNPNADPMEFIVGKHEFFPVPLSEVVITDGLIQQNPLY